MARSFSEREREIIREKLLEACRQSWTKYGYKKTNVDELCQQAAISKGAFYLFFASKEALFCEVLCAVQEEIYLAASQILDRQPGRRGAAEALKMIYRAYDKNNFLYHADSADFIILTNKLSEEQASRLARSTALGQQLFGDHPQLKCRVDKNTVLSVIYALLMNVKNRDVLPRDHIETFDFMVDSIIDKLYE